MGLALYISLEALVEGFDVSCISGKSLARAQDELKERCDRLGVKDLMSFYSAAPGETAELLDGAGDVMADALAELQELQASFGPPLTQAFASPRTSPETLRAQLNAAADAAKSAPAAPERWFPAADGLKTVRGLIASISADVEAGNEVVFCDRWARVDSILTDLHEMERMLAAAQAQGVGFHMSFDF